MDKNLLKEILGYKNENVISRFTDKYAVSNKEAESIFTETKKYLFLSFNEKDIAIYDDLLIIDEMWHNFILFTKDYYDFSLKYFKRFQHHVPASKKEKDAAKKRIAADPALAQKRYLAEMEFLMNKTCDYFGKATLNKWFDIYPEKYSPENIIKLIRK